MSLQIKIVSQDKSRWSEGTLVTIELDKKYLGSTDHVDAADELKAVRQQFDENPALEFSTVVSRGKKSTRLALFLSTRQVKYYSQADKLRVLGSRAVRFARKMKNDQLVLPMENATEFDIKAVLHGAMLAAYSFSKYKSARNENEPVRVSVIVEKSQLKNIQAAVKRLEILGGGVALARDLVNEIPAELYPDKLASIAREKVAEAGVKVTVFDEKRLVKERFNGVVTVGRGSNRPPRLVLMEYNPARKSRFHLCLVGKAVTFDTGGHSLKPSKNMWEMKGDMAGGAAVIGAMKVIGQLRPDITVTGIVPSALNAIGPDAMVPGDIIRSRSGRTVHVDNTDAEGRLLLMDALDYAQSLSATHIVDVATLTGSIVRALGEAMSGLFSNDDSLAEAIMQCGTAVGEEYWRMPLIEEYREQLDHPVADLDNVGKSINAGSITAALFLKEFVSDSVKWAHLDIAASGLFTKSYKAWGPGGSGFGVQTLVALATRLAQSR